MGYAPLDACKDVRYMFSKEELGAEFIPIFDAMYDYIATYFKEGNRFETFIDRYVKDLVRIKKLGKFPRSYADEYLDLINRAIESMNNVAGNNHGEALLKKISVDHWVDYFTYAGVTSVWQDYMYAYKFDKSFAQMLMSMEEKPIYDVEAFSAFPCKVVYLDLSDLAGYICKGLLGCFVTYVANDRDTLSLVFLPVFQNRQILGFRWRFEYGRTMLTPWKGILYEEKGVRYIDTSIIDETSDYLPLLDKQPFRERDLVTLFLNFVMYLKAKNRDVVISHGEGKKKPYIRNSIGNGSKKISASAVKEYEVGYRISIDRRLYGSEVRVENANQKGTGKGGLGVKKSPHFRRAHWHHHWVGSGDNRHLELRWQEGSFVGGKGSAEVVSVHKVSEK